MRWILGNNRNHAKVKAHMKVSKKYINKSFLLIYTFIELVQNTSWAVGRFPSENISIKVTEFCSKSVLWYNG